MGSSASLRGAARLAIGMMLLTSVCACGTRSSNATASGPSSPVGPVLPLPADIKVEVTPDLITISNGLVERAWTRKPFRTDHFTDLRNGKVWSSAGDGAKDFALTVASVESAAVPLRLELGSDQFSVGDEPLVETTAKGSVRVTLTLKSALLVGLTVTRTIEIYPGVAGLRSETSLASLLPLVLSGYTLEAAHPAGAVHGAMHAFRAGSDWREPEWAGPPLRIGDAHTGDWRLTTEGDNLLGNAEWLSLADDADRRLFYVLERNDQASSMMGFSGGNARAFVDFSRDIVYVGPIEEQVHVENPFSTPARVRLIIPGTPLRMEPVFTGLAANADDEPWQHYKYLSGFRMPPYRREVTFNSNGVDDNKISTGAKDDMDFDTFLTELDLAKRVGIEAFVFDDGWQGRSGDWCPDSPGDDPACQDPRRGTDKGYPPRFPDASFAAVQAQLRPAGMSLGLWMSPMHFHPTAVAFKNNPQWACLPLSAALLAENEAQPYSSSSEAGIVQWNPEALSPSDGKFIDYLEGRIRRAIDDWGVRYFKFDFTAWLDCVGVFPVDMYTYRESFMAMLDRIHADHPDVTIQMDETNDYRLWPFEALARGPTWYQNGSPAPNESLHANYVLAPYVPLFALGRAALRTGDLDHLSADYQMQVALLSHVTFFNDLRDIPDSAIPAIRKWTDYYKAHRADLAQFAYPLLAEDPISGDNWAAFQTWDADAGRGMLLVYRQNTTDSSRTIQLRNVPDGQYRLLEAPAESSTQSYSAQQLRDGITVSVAAPQSARIFRIERRN